ncbi:MAG: chromosomal replication initiator protein DnaA [Lentisphaeria bacterium]|nr:chromosomal replication initiator protein DnaA [Lentisphaeria bacterium]
MKVNWGKMDCSNMAAEAVWEIASLRLKKLNKNNYTQWFSKMQPLRTENDLLVLGVPDEFFGQLAEESCGSSLADSLVNIQGVDYRYTFEKSKSPRSRKKAAKINDRNEEQLELFSLDVYDSEQKSTEPDICPSSDAGESPAVPAAAEIPVAVPAEDTRQLPRWRNVNTATFDNFIVGDDNRGAYTAARAVAEEPGALYNPLFLYGTNGIGKTHLLQSIAHAVNDMRPSYTVRCTSCSELVNDFYRIMSEHRNTGEFRDKLLDADVLLVDDVHGLAKKVQMQEEFFNVFNTLIRRGKQIVMTCDRQPCEIADIDKRLTTRFESGVICQIGMPEYEARMVILKMWRKNILTNTWLPDDVLEFLASNIRSSVRRLKSAFMTLSFHASLSGKSDISVAEAEDQLHALIAEELTSRAISVEDIQRTVAEFFNLTIADLLGTKRTKNIAEPRMVAMSLARELTQDSSTAVGAAFGRNHATILHAEKQVELLCAKDENMRRSVVQIKRKLQK